LQWRFARQIRQSVKRGAWPATCLDGICDAAGCCSDRFCGFLNSFGGFPPTFRGGVGWSFDFADHLNLPWILPDQISYAGSCPSALIDKD
jgi:hypothetical protein